MSVFAVEYNAANYMESALAPVEAENKRRVMENTWGHLAPKKSVGYAGWMLFTLTAYGDLVLIDSHWKGLPDSPWLFDDMNEFVSRRAKVRGVIYRFDGHYRNHKLSGKVRRVELR